jgi:hypothetical protein
MMKYRDKFKGATMAMAFVLLNLTAQNGNAQITERERPAEWENLVYGGRFMDRFLPMPAQGPLTSDTWGTAGVKPRYIENGLEDNEWSYWGGNALLGDDGKYHLFVCRWPEDSEKGHMAWPNSEVVHAVSDDSFGPYKVLETIGKGHNPEIFQLKDRRFVIYFYKGYYISNSLYGPWEAGTFEFNRRDRKIVDGLSNLTFAQREDGSIIMVCRGGGIWFSETGLSPYNQVTEKRVYPPVDGRFEDPVIWKTNIQYHMIVNDWFGRIAWYLRSKDGINWKVDPGEAYMPGIAKYEDGTQEDWFKYERIKMLQDDLGRATQAHFAVIDTIKWNDLKSDTHSSKHICIPLTVGRQLTIMNEDKIDEKTSEIRVLIKAEKGFDPHKDMDLQSLRFGASEEVNFGRGAKVLRSEKHGDDLLVTFEGMGNGLTDDNFAAKLLGKTKQGKLLFGYSRLPGIDYLQAALSAKLPEITKSKNGFFAELEVQNFGQVNSIPTKIDLEVEVDGKLVKLASTEVPMLKPFEKTTLKIRNTKGVGKTGTSNVRITIYPINQQPITLHGEVTIKSQ